jgi:hypothetical protein
MTDTRTKADIQKENDELKQQIADLAEDRSELLSSLSNLTDRVDQMSNDMQTARESGQDTDPAPELVYDPFDEQNPHAILAHPEGWVLSWKNPDYRAKRGWRGWIPIEYDDEVGQNLSQYLKDPPARMEGVSQLDNYVRRGTDSILCKLPADIWDARQNKRVKNSAQRFKATEMAQNQRHRQYTEYGEGVVRRDSGNAPMEGGEPAPMVRTPMLRRD